MLVAPGLTVSVVETESGILTYLLSIGCRLRMRSKFHTVVTAKCSWSVAEMVGLGAVVCRNHQRAEVTSLPTVGYC
jgi:hypothetical protein